MDVLERWTFSHTPEEAMSVGLAKACVPRKKWFCSREIEFLNKEQSSIFVLENNALVPPKSTNYVFFHEPRKWCFRYDHQTMWLSQVGWDECNWSTKYLLCQDVILYQTVDTIDNVKQRKIPDYANQIIRQGIHVPIVTCKGTYQNEKIDKMMNCG